MNRPIAVLKSLQQMRSPRLSKQDSAAVYPKVRAKLQELRELKVPEDFLNLIDEGVQVTLEMRPGDGVASGAQLC
jgi:hypothetical protein